MRLVKAEEEEEERPALGATMTYEEIVRALIGQVSSVECARWACSCCFRCSVDNATRGYSIKRGLY